MRLVSLCALLVACAALARSDAALAADAARGRSLYESACGGCHAESVHGREKRVAADYDAIRGWVRRWSASLGLQWTDDEVADVTAHLNARYYRFACPPSECRVTGSREEGRSSRLALDDRRR